MKKTFFTLVFSSVITLASFGQTTVSLANTKISSFNGNQQLIDTGSGFINIVPYSNRNKQFILKVMCKRVESVQFSSKTAYKLNEDSSINFIWNGKPTILTIKTY